MKIVVFAVLGAAGCASVFGTASPAAAQTRPSVPVSYKTIARKKAKLYDIKARFPVFAGTTPVVRLANSAARAEAERMADAFVERALSDKKEFGAEGFHGDYTMEIKPVVSLARPDLLSFYFEQYAYLGGAHPSTNYTTFNFGMQKGGAKRLELRDVFQTEFNPYGGLDKYLIPVLRERKASSVTDDMLKTLGKNELKNWCVTPGGLTFIFEPYAVASYAEGTFVVKKSFAEMGDVLNTRGPLAELL